MIKKVLFGMLLALYILLSSHTETFAETNNFIFGPNVSLEELESTLLFEIKSKDYLYVTKMHRTLETYYDIPQLSLLSENRFIRYQAREKIGRIKKIAINHQERLIQKKSKYIMEAQMMAKDGTTVSSPLRQYKNASSQIGKHPLLGMIERDGQEAAIKFLKENGIDTPLALKGMMHVSNIDLFIGVYGNDDKRLMGIMNLVAFYNTKTGDHIMTRLLLEDGDERVGQLVEKIGHQFKAETGLTKDDEVICDYALLYNQMAKTDRFFSYRLRYPSVFNLGHASVLFIGGLGLIGIFFGKRFFQDKEVMRTDG